MKQTACKRLICFTATDNERLEAVAKRLEAPSFAETIRILIRNEHRKLFPSKDLEQSGKNS